MTRRTRQTTNCAAQVLHYELYLVGSWSQELSTHAEVVNRTGNRKYLSGAGSNYAQLLEIAGARLRGYAEKTYLGYFSDAQSQMLICTFLSFLNSAAIKGVMTQRNEFLEAFGDWISQFRPAFTNLDQLHIDDKNAFDSRFKFRVESASVRKLYRDL